MYQSSRPCLDLNSRRQRRVQGEKDQTTACVHVVTPPRISGESRTRRAIAKFEIRGSRATCMNIRDSRARALKTEREQASAPVAGPERNSAQHDSALH